jgi:peroxiredoxin
MVAWLQNKHMKQPFLYVIIGLLCVSILVSFWYQEWKYLLPTPVPEGYKNVIPHTALKLDAAIQFQAGKPVFLHFFSPKCPCSRFNLTQFKDLVKKYKAQINFHAVLFVEDEAYTKAEFLKDYGLDIPVLTKKGEKIAETCGVYATLQAVLLTKDSKLYYRGNYNRTRFCVDKNTNFAEKAIQEILKGNAPPDFGKAAVMAYGCEIPLD